MAHPFFDALHLSGIPALARLVPSRHLVVLNFHRVRDEASDFHDGMIETNSRQFRKHIDWLSKRVDFVGEEDLRKLSPSSRLRVLLTFDDGYIDVFEIIAPILEEKGIPAIFFVSPGILDKRVLGSWDRIAYLVKKFSGKNFRFRGREFSVERGTRPVYLELGSWSQSSLPDQGDEFVAELAESLRIPLPTVSQQSRELLTWDQVRTLKKRGFTIGCHALTHRVLSSLGLDEQEEEIILARSRLEAEGIPTQSFAYPFGSPDTYCWETRQAAIKAGFKFVFSFNGQSIVASKFNPAKIDRIAFKSSISKYDFLISFPSLHNFLYGIRKRKEQQW